MSFSTLAEFQGLLLRLKLVEPRQLQDCLARIQARGPSVDALLASLEERHYLTPYQVAKLKKRETDGLRLGPYKLLYRNASGSFARVFRGCSVDNGRMVGIKILRERWAKDQRTVGLFRREGELGKRLKHKNIVPIYEVGSDAGQHYLTMEFIEGGNLRELLKSRGKFPVDQAAQFVLDMAEGLEYALSLGLTHRDLKLSNVLLSAQGVAKLVDFGLAGQDSGLSALEEEVDRAVEYATLERTTGAPDNDPRSDLYFLGAIFYELLTGVPPYPPTKNIAERKQAGRYRNVRPVRDVDPSIPRPIEAIVERLMEIVPSARYQTPTEVIADLRTALGKEAAQGKDAELVDSDPQFPILSGEPNGQSPTILCVENRPKQQDSLREYFNKHGYRVLLVRDAERAIKRIQDDPPRGVVLMADSLGDDPNLMLKAYDRAVSCGSRSKTAVVLVLAKKHLDLRSRFTETPQSRVLAEQPVTLRAIRTALEEIQPKAK
jgi:eukaryotic-like serine/threonine-protein kinase